MEIEGHLASTEMAEAGTAVYWGMQVPCIGAAAAAAVMYCKEGKNNHSGQTAVRTVYWIVYWIGRATHSASGAEGQMVHLLGEGPHHVGWLHGYGVVHGWRNHSTLWVGTHTHSMQFHV